MKQLNDDLFNKNRDLTVARQKMLTEINRQLKEFSCRNIPLHECLTKTGALSAELITEHYANVKIPDKVHDSILIMFTNYYVLLHIDNYSGNYTVNKDYIFNQAVQINEEAIAEISRNKKLKIFDLQTANYRSLEFINRLVDIYYNTGIDGCFKYFTHSIYSTLESVSPNHGMSKDKIEKLIRALQAEKFLNLFHSDLKIWS